MALARRLFGVVFFVAVLVGGWRFASLNAQPIQVDLLVTGLPSVPLWLALLVAFFAGVLAIGMLTLYPLARASLIARRYRRTVAGLESEVHQLRNLPLAAEERFDDTLGTPEGSGRSA